MIDRIRIGLWWYKVVAEDEIKDDDGRGLMGQCRHMSRELAVSRKTWGEDGEAKNTIWHEALHAIDYQFHLGLKESQVLRLANALETVLTDNPDFMQICQQLRGQDREGKEVGQA